MTRKSILRNRILAAVLTVTIAITAFPSFAVTTEQAQPNITGLLADFEGEYELSDGDAPVSVIVLFERDTAAVQLEEAQNEGLFLTEKRAERIAEDSRELFKRELDGLFSSSKGAKPYEIVCEYRVALNGVNIVLPSNMVNDVAAFKSVGDITPDYKTNLEPPPVFEPEPITYANAPKSALTSERNPAGMKPGRETMKANEMHELGYKGEGVVVAVVDTGIYYQHPAFKGAFMTIGEMQQRGVNVTDADGLCVDNNDDCGACQHCKNVCGCERYFVGRNFMAGPYENPKNDPSEVLPDTPGRVDGTHHGTHVSGTAVGRDTGEDKAILGIAPESKLFVYRAISSTAGGSGGYSSDIIEALEQIVYDKADVVNMSFGSYENSAADILSVAINNIMLANPNMVFVAAAGNNGSRGSYSINSPASSSMVVSVAYIYLNVISYLEGTYNKNPARWLPSSTSSRGPMHESFEIKPDIGAHGETVLSSVPFWYNSSGYHHGSGTSMASPHIAGAAALLIQYSRENAAQWSAAEIKARLMNNAFEFGKYKDDNYETEVGAFESGAGYADIFAAARADTVVYAEYEKVACGNQLYVPFLTVPFKERTFTTAQTGSLSFGAINKTIETMDKTIQLSVVNESNFDRTYTVEYEFGKKSPEEFAELSFSSTDIPVNAGEEAQFTASMFIGRDAPAGFYEGIITVSAQDGFAARLPFAAVVLETKVAEVFDENSLRAAAAAAGASMVPVEIVLLNDITLSETKSALTLPRNTEIILKSGGGVRRSLIAGGDYDVIDVKLSTQLTIDGVDITREVGTNGSGVNSNGVLTLKAGVISGHNGTHGGGVHNSSEGIFTMSGGEISGNKSKSNGGGVYAFGRFTMSGGEIFGNEAEERGGGVYSIRNFVMDGGKISDNKATVCGGGVYTTAGSFTMNEGEISANSVKLHHGGGVYNMGKFKLYGGEISGNTAIDGGGVYNPMGISNPIEFEMYGGEIKANTAIDGGGVHNGGIFIMEDGDISDNSAQRGGGIYENGDITVNGGKISSNTAKYGGGIEISVNNLRTPGKLRIGENAVFADNTTTSANPARNRLPEDDALYDEYILGTKWTDPFTQGFNNVDISYDEGTKAAIRTIHFELNGTSDYPTDPLTLEPIKAIRDAPITHAPSFPAEPKRVSHKFIGWYLDPDFENPLTDGVLTPDNDATILYARWKYQHFELSLDQSGTHTFPEVTYGYSPQAPLPVTATNIGNEPTGALTIALSGANPSAFTLSETDITDITPDNHDTFTVAPNTGLSAGTYGATVTVSGGNGISEAFGVSFTVNKADGAAVSAPSVSGVTASSIKVNAVAAPTNGQAVEYAVSATDDTADIIGGWQSGLIFGGLNNSVKYYIFARSAQNGNYNAGAVSAATEARTLERCDECGEYPCACPETLYIKSVKVTGDGWIIEIRNPAEAAVSSKGLFLSNENGGEDGLFKWKMPTVIFQPKQTVSVEVGDTGVALIWKRMLVKFGLAAEETLYLTDASGYTLSLFEIS